MEIAQQRPRDISANTLKILAITTMLIDHVATGFVPRGSAAAMVMHTLGRLTAPIMCYMIAEGFHYTSNVRKYAGRLFLFAAISHFPYVWYFKLTWYKTTSVFWGLALGLVALAVYSKKDWPVLLRLGGVVLCCVLATVGDWSYISVLWILLFGIFRGSYPLQMVSFALVGVGLYALPGILASTGNAWMFGVLLAIPLLYFYHGRRGRKSNLLKWGFYIFYPLHLLVLYLIRLIA